MRKFVENSENVVKLKKRVIQSGLIKIPLVGMFNAFQNNLDLWLAAIFLFQ